MSAIRSYNVNDKWTPPKIATAAQIAFVAIAIGWFISLTLPSIKHLPVCAWALPVAVSPVVLLGLRALVLKSLGDSLYIITTNVEPYKKLGWFYTNRENALDFAQGERLLGPLVNHGGEED